MIRIYYALYRNGLCFFPALPLTIPASFVSFVFLFVALNSAPPPTPYRTTFDFAPLRPTRTAHDRAHVLEPELFDSPGDLFTVKLAESELEDTPEHLG
jgi:hypothetical protein